MANEFEDYPKAKIAVQGGELQDAYDISLTFEDGETEVHTFADGGMAKGSTGGKRKGTCTFKSAISKAGFERDYMGNYKKRKVVNVRVKVPGKTYTITGRFRAPSITANVDNFIDFSIAIAGKWSDS